MKKNLLFSLAAVLILCVGIYIGATFNNQKNTSDSTSEKEVTPEEIEYSDNKVVSDESEGSTEIAESKKEIEDMTQEDKVWLFQQVYDGIHGMMEGSGASDEEYLFAELSELSSLADTASRNFFNNREAPDTLEDEYKAWRADNHGNKGSTNSTTSKTDTTNKVTETQKPAQPQQNQTQKKPAQNQSQSQQKPAQNNSAQSNAGQTVDEIPFASVGGELTSEEEQQAIENTRKAAEAHTEITFR